MSTSIGEDLTHGGNGHGKQYGVNVMTVVSTSKRPRLTDCALPSVVP